MCALYAFMRITDDLGDDGSQSVPRRSAALVSWRRALADALAGQPTSDAVLPALADVQQRHDIPPEHLYAVITGVEMDLNHQGFATFDDLARYCDHVAGAVGRCCIHIWGFEDATAHDRAIDCGRAFQLTNILRDLAEDANADRTYLPREDLERFELTTDDIKKRVRDERFRRLMSFQVARAHQYYAKALDLHGLLAPPGRPILKAMLEIYGGLLQEIERRNYDVYSRRIELSSSQKRMIAIRCLLGPSRPPQAS